MIEFDAWYLEHLVCPLGGSPLRLEGAFLVSESGRRFPIVEGIPIMLLDDVPETIGVARASLELGMAVASRQTTRKPSLYLETLGITDEERAIAQSLYEGGSTYDPVVAVMVGATSGIAYKHLIGLQGSYPIPALRFPTPKPGHFLDIGSNWGRWAIAAARAGHHAVGIDPQLGSVLAARRVAAQLNIPAHFVVGDARYLPFRDKAFDYVWSYSVLQHFARGDAKLSLREMGRVARNGGVVRVQMANAFGIRSLYHMARRRFRPPTGFEVRYWSALELKREFSAAIGRVKFEADCFLGLGLQWSDFGKMSLFGKSALVASEILRRASIFIFPLRWFSDSLFCTVQTPAKCRNR